MVNNKYDDIINLPRHISKTRRPMSQKNRAAQFAPFAALSGFESSIKETARLTDSKIELDEYDKLYLNEKIKIIQNSLKDKNLVKITYFKKDKTKEGGSYIVIEGIVKDIDEYNLTIIMKDNSKIIINDILEIESELFDFI
ncbi:MAG: hypothetical protein GX675_00490 [Erysipelotrichaceae bacterium]|nr:hypothetical protein [Erysipelotrichaceae bacterium]